VADAGTMVWQPLTHLGQLGLPAPVSRLLLALPVVT
jgi:hypothetical protein